VLEVFSTTDRHSTLRYSLSVRLLRTDLYIHADNELCQVAMMSRITLDLKRQSNPVMGATPTAAGAPALSVEQEMVFRPGRVEHSGGHGSIRRAGAEDPAHDPSADPSPSHREMA
jgi:hypothetical protein